MSKSSFLVRKIKHRLFSFVIKKRQEILISYLYDILRLASSLTYCFVLQIDLY